MLGPLSGTGHTNIVCLLYAPATSDAHRIRCINPFLNLIFTVTGISGVKTPYNDAVTKEPAGILYDSTNNWIYFTDGEPTLFSNSGSGSLWGGLLAALAACPVLHCTVLHSHSHLLCRLSHEPMQASKSCAASPLPQDAPSPQCSSWAASLTLLLHRLPQSDHRVAQSHCRHQ